MSGGTLKFEADQPIDPGEGPAPSPFSMALPKNTLTVAVGGGKGGVGKSVVAANLGVAMAQLGFRVIIVDADLGSANQHTLFGIERPKYTLQALLDKEIATLEEAVQPTRVKRLFLVPGSGAVVGAANIPHARKLKLMRNIQALDAEVVLVDCGAGSSFNVVDFFAMADQRLLVVSPQLTSMQNAYGFLKAAVYRVARHAALNHREREAFGLATRGKETERMRDVLERLGREEPDLVRALRRSISAFECSLIGNQLSNDGQTSALTALSRMIKDFLSMDVPVRATLRRSEFIHASVSRRRPFVLENPGTREARALSALAEHLLLTDVSSIREARRREMPVTDEVELPGPLANYLRRHPRLETEMAAVLIVDGAEHEAQVVDVSAGGARIVTDVEIPEDSPVTLRLEQHANKPTLAAIVRHQADGMVGLEFADEATKRQAGALLPQLSRQTRVAS